MFLVPLEMKVFLNFLVSFFLLVWVCKSLFIRNILALMLVWPFFLIYVNMTLDSCI